MPETLPHPTPEDLSAYSLGQLAEEQATIIDDHISDCERCCETIVGFSKDDTFVELLQEAKQLPTDLAASRTLMRATSDSESSGIPSALLEHLRYEIVGLIGKGGMGDVYRARHRMMDRAVALKIIKPQLVRKPEAVERFHREVKAAARLSHPNIVTSHDAEQADDVHYLVMEYVDGINLAQAVNERGALSIVDACDYVRQAANGLHHAYEQGMVHRDIKPHNLMVTEDGTVKILDFGLASLVPSTVPGADTVEVNSGLTLAGTIMGTPDFISPEQAQDAHQADIRSDIYSLGTTLYFLLSGRPPFHDGSVMSKVKNHAQTVPEPLASLRDDIPADVVAVVTRMTAKNPEERFQTPAEVADALESFSKASQLNGAELQLQDPSGGGILKRPNAQKLKSPRSQLQDRRAKDHEPIRSRSRVQKLTPAATILVAAIVLAFFIQQAMQRNGIGEDNEVHAPLGELESYVTSMMTSPHDLVFLNLGEIGTDENYVVLKPIKGGVTMRFPVFGRAPWDKRQSQYIRRISEVGESLSLPLNEQSEVRNGSIEGVNFTLTVTGAPQTVADKVQQVVKQTFQVDSSEDCRFTYRNLPAGDATAQGERTSLVSADEFIREHQRGVKVYYGEINNWIYLIPQERRAEAPLKRDADIWVTDLRLLPSGFADRLRDGGPADELDKSDNVEARSWTAEEHAAITPKLKLAISEAAGIPTDEWEKFARSQAATFDGIITGEPLSIALLKLSPKKAAIANPDVLEDFQMLRDGVPQPTEIHNAMASSKARGFYSMLQPRSLTGLRMKVEFGKADTAQINGAVRFQSNNLYEGEVEFIVNVNADSDLTVTEFKLPNYGIIIRRVADQTWKQVKVKPRVSVGNESNDAATPAASLSYDLSLVPATARYVAGARPRQILRGPRLAKLRESAPPISGFTSLFINDNAAQVLTVALRKPKRLSNPSVQILTVIDGDAMEEVDRAIGIQAPPQDGTESIFQRTDYVSHRGRYFVRRIDRKTVILGTLEAIAAHQKAMPDSLPNKFPEVARTMQDSVFFLIANTQGKEFFDTQPSKPDHELLVKLRDIYLSSKFMTASVSLGAVPRLQFTVRTEDPERQKDMAVAVRSLRGVLVTLMTEFTKSLPSGADFSGPFFKDNETAAAAFASLLESKVSEPTDKDTVFDIPLNPSMSAVLRFITEEFDAKRVERRRVAANLKHIGRGFLRFEEEHGFLPSVATEIPGAAHPISWRVAILPYIDQEEVYADYKLDERWDSDHNKKLLARMPKVYRHPNSWRKNTDTNVVTFVGETATGTAGHPVSIGSGFGDDPSQTILAAESAAKIPWTKPEDPEFAADKPLPSIGKLTADGWHATFADGSVKFIPANTSVDVIAAMLNRDGGDAIENDEH